jgi:cytochrome c5
MLYFMPTENLPHARMLPSVLCMVAAAGFMLALQISRASDLDAARNGTPAIANLAKQGYTRISFEKVPSAQCQPNNSGHDFSAQSPEGKTVFGTFCASSNGIGQSVALR